VPDSQDAVIRGASDFLAARQEIDFARAAEEVMAAIRDLHEQGGIDDVFGKLPGEGNQGDAAETAVREPLRYSMFTESSEAVFRQGQSTTSRV
jgi:hypothetical protein